MRHYHAVVALHPNEPKPNIEAMSDVVPAPLMEFIFDTTRTVIYMSQNNVFSKYPNIKWIIPYCGALLPVIAQCVDMDKIVYGSDAPYTSDQVVTMLADELESTELISRHELEKMLYDNGKQLLKSINEK